MAFKLLAIGSVLSAALLESTFAIQLRATETTPSEEVLRKINDLGVLTKEGTFSLSGQQDFLPQLDTDMFLAISNQDKHRKDEGVLPRPITTITASADRESQMLLEKTEDHEDVNKGLFLQKSAKSDVAKNRKFGFGTTQNTGMMEAINRDIFLEKSQAGGKQELTAALESAAQNGDLSGQTQKSSLYNAKRFADDRFKNFDSIGTGLNYDDFTEIAKQVAPEGKTIKWYLDNAGTLALTVPDADELAAKAKSARKPVNVPFITSSSK